MVELSDFQRGMMRINGMLRRPEVMIFLPALTLAGFWLGGEGTLILLALGLPMVFVMTGAFSQAPAPAAALGEVGLRADVTAALDAVLRQGHASGLTTACLVLQFDEADRFLDRHGRAVQAEMLQRSAERICTALRQGDTVARLEGGGLAVALGPVRRLDLETLVQVAGRLQTAIGAPMAIEGAQIYVTCSVGFCLVSRAPQATGRAMLDAAQVAADEALRNGPGAIRSFSPDMARTRADREARRDLLEAALDEGQIRPHFQPQISTDTGELTGLETLARWHHPERGILSPAEFLPAIEEAGLAERLGEVMMFHALTSLSRWDKAGLAVPCISVNFSGAELQNPRLPERIKWELDRFDLASSRLTVEILETVVTRTDDDVTVQNIAALARLGCNIDLDDFGTGHASITNIRRFGVRRIKIDRSLVTRVDSDREQQKMIAAILSMAERLGIDTLAEGVESAGEHTMLAQLGCRHVQGFAIARPMDFDATTDWIRIHAGRLGIPPRLGHRSA